MRLPASACGRPLTDTHPLPYASAASVRAVHAAASSSPTPQHKTLLLNAGLMYDHSLAQAHTGLYCWGPHYIAIVPNGLP